MRPTDEDRRPPETAVEVDAALRRALEPDAATAERLVGRALAAPGAQPAFRLQALRHWRLAAAAAAVAVLVAVALPILLPESPAPDAPAPLASADPHAVEPAALRISNEHGSVTVTSSAGSKIVFLPLYLDPTDPGDAS